MDEWLQGAKQRQWRVEEEIDGDYCELCIVFTPLKRGAEYRIITEEVQFPQWHEASKEMLQYICNLHNATLPPKE